MSALGQKQTLDWRPLMSALPPKADIDGARWAALLRLGRTSHHALDHHGRDAREHGLGHRGCQDVGDWT
jgi:hypothetical protein